MCGENREKTTNSRYFNLKEAAKTFERERDHREEGRNKSFTHKDTRDSGDSWKTWGFSPPHESFVEEAEETVFQGLTECYQDWGLQYFILSVKVKR